MRSDSPHPVLERENVGCHGVIYCTAYVSQGTSDHQGGSPWGRMAWPWDTKGGHRVIFAHLPHTPTLTYT